MQRAKCLESRACAFISSTLNLSLINSYPALGAVGSFHFCEQFGTPWSIAGLWIHQETVNCICLGTEQILTMRTGMPTSGREIEARGINLDLSGYQDTLGPPSSSFLLTTLKPLAHSWTLFHFEGHCRLSHSIYLTCALLVFFLYHATYATSSESSFQSAISIRQAKAESQEAFEKTDQHCRGGRLLWYSIA